MKKLLIQSVAMILAMSNTLAVAAKSGKDNLHFTQNIGQVTDQNYMLRHDIDFKVKGGNGLSIFIGSGKMHYQFSKAAIASNNESISREESQPTEMYRLDVELVGGNPNAKVITEGKVQQFERYYTNGLEGAVANHFNRITYKDVYPNIDWTFYFNSKGQLEHDFIVHPNGRVSDIKVRYSGATELMLNEDGSLTAYTPFGTVAEAAPYAYTKPSNTVVASAFVLEGSTITFSIADYSGTLVIGPVLEWASYFGDSDYDDITGIEHDGTDHIYVVGSTNSSSNIATTGSHQATIGGNSDAFMAKFKKNGTLEWATYYGGTGNDYGRGITIDTAGKIYLAGRTQSATGITTAGSYQDAKAGTAASYDAFIAKFDTAGQREWGTYYGGTGQDGSQHFNIAADGFDNIYLTGNTQSANGIATQGAFQEVRPGGHDAFLAKFSTSGHLSWATYYGGSAGDYGSSVTADMTGNVYLLGYSGSTGIATANAHQPANAGSDDVFIAKFDSTGSRIWDTYYGGANIDWGYAIQSDDSCNIYVVGTTVSTSGISTLQSHQPNYGGGSQDGFVVKLDSAGQVQWATYVGGSSHDVCMGIHIGPNGSSYVLGYTSSSNSIATLGALNPNLNGFCDAFVLCFDNEGANIWGSYFGGNDGEEVMAITGDGFSNIYFAGLTNSASQLATANAYQTTFGGNVDGMVWRINDCEAPMAPLAILGDNEICGNDTILYSIAPVMGADNYIWILPAGWIGNSDSTSISVTPNNNQSGTIRVAATNYCTTSDTISLAITVKPAPQPVIQRNANILSVTQPYSSYQWNMNGLPIVGANGSTHIITVNGNYTVSIVADNDCSATSDVFVVDNVSNQIIEGRNYSIFPNPATGSLTIEVPKNCQVSVYDITGMEWIKQSLNTGVHTVDIGLLGNGMYLIKLYNEEGSIIGTEKFLKVTE